MSKEDPWPVSPAQQSAEAAPASFGLIAHCIAWGLFLVLLTVIVPRIEAIFQDFGTPLPRPTRLLIRASHLVIWAAAPLVAIPSLLLVLLGMDWLILNIRPERGEARLARTWSALMLASPLLLIALTLAALVLPLLTILTRVTG
jgi:type II secretory pathway component PulF